METNIDNVKLKVTEKQLLNFNFRFIRHIGMYLYEVVDAKKWSKEVGASKPHEIFNDSMAFWTDECDDHAHVLYFKDVLAVN